jgi:DegV family protein with EDD domain
VTIVPLTIRFGDREFVDGVTIDSRKFYEMLVESDGLPTTSQANPGAFADAFEDAVAAGFDVVCITCSGKLSGTNQSAVIAASEYPGKVFVVDSKTITLGSAILTEYALALLDRGLSAEEIAWKLLQKRDKVRVIAMLDTLEYLQKGGRISKTVAFAGSILSIKPVLSVSDGEVSMLGKARGSKQGNNLLVQEIEKAGGVDFTKPVLLGYTGLSDAMLRKYIEDSKHLWEQGLETVRYTTIGSVIGTHAGPGAVAVAFFKS